MTSGGGSAVRAGAGALRLGNAVGAAFTNRRVLEPVESRIRLTVGVALNESIQLAAYVGVGDIPGPQET